MSLTVQEHIKFPYPPLLFYAFQLLTWSWVFPPRLPRHDQTYLLSQW